MRREKVTKTLFIMMCLKRCEYILFGWGTEDDSTKIKEQKQKM